MSTIIRQFANLRRNFIFIFLVGVAVFYFSSNAIASYSSSNQAAEPPVGSLALSDLNEILLNQSAALSQEVNQALEEAGKDDVGCVAPLLQRPFYDLNHSRVAPFSCFFADNKSLIIRAKNLAILPGGETVALEQLLERDDVPEGVSLQFNLTDWQWIEAND